MNIQTVSGFQEVDDLFLCLPKTVTWTEAESNRLAGLYERGNHVHLETDLVQMVFKMSKPFDENDDEIDNMLNWEAWRFEFEANNESYLALKKKELALQQDMLSFMKENLLCFSFAVTEMKRRLVEPFEVFQTYPSIHMLEKRLVELSDILTNGKMNSQSNGNSAQLRRNFYGIG
jgi:hypothetical protein